MPLLTIGWPTQLKLFYLTLPIYMIHQYEEWDKDRFRIFLNNHLGRGKNLLTHKAGFVINIFGVWGVIAAALYLAFHSLVRATERTHLASDRFVFDWLYRHHSRLHECVHHDRIGVG